MVEINMTLLPEYFDLINNNIKIYEIRIKREKESKINKNDIIIFKKRPELKEELKVKVEDILLFSSIKQAIENLPKKEIGFENKTNEEILKIYRDIYNNENEEKDKGVIVYKIYKI